MLTPEFLIDGTPQEVFLFVAFALVVAAISVVLCLGIDAYADQVRRQEADDAFIAEIVGRVRKEVLSPSEESLEDESEPAGVCRVCGCTDHDCRACIERTGKPCHWVETDLCSACAQTTPIWDLVIEDMRGRDQLGRERYKTPLTAVEDGRDALQEAYEELLDTCVYLKQEIVRKRLTGGARDQE